MSEDDNNDTVRGEQEALAAVSVFRSECADDADWEKADRCPEQEKEKIGRNPYRLQCVRHDLRCCRQTCSQADNRRYEAVREDLMNLPKGPKQI